MSNYLFSVVIYCKSAHGESKVNDFLREQSEKNIQLLTIVDDGSKKMTELYSEVIKKAEGRYFCFFDDEINYPDDCLEIIHNYFMKNSQLMTAYVPIKNNRYETDSSEYYMYDAKDDSGIDLCSDYRVSINCPGAFFFRKEVLGEDIEFRCEEDILKVYLMDVLRKYPKVGIVRNVSLIHSLSGTINGLNIWKRMFEESDAQFLRYSAIRNIIETAYSSNITEFPESVTEIIKSIDDYLIIRGFGMQDMSRVIMFLTQKHGRQPRLTYTRNDVLVGRLLRPFGRMSYQSAIIHFIEINDGILTIEGETSVPACIDKLYIQVYAEVNGKEIPCIMQERENNKTLLGGIYEYCKSFKFEISADKASEIKFFHKIKRSKVYYTANTCMRFAPVSNELSNGYAYRNGYIIECRKNIISCIKADDREVNECEKKFAIALYETGKAEAKEAVRFRRYYHYVIKRKTKPVWIFFDRIDKSDDNGEAMFEYVRKYHSDEINAYFIIDKNCPDFERLKPLGNIVKAHSVKHKMLQVIADYILSSQANGFTENPFGMDEVYYRDLIHQAKVVFLQHGITKDNQTKWLNRYNQNLYGLITSCKREYNSILEYDYYYDKSKVWLTGMPRFDRLYHNEQKKILIMPTWRKSLMELTWNSSLKSYLWTMKSDFSKTEYFHRYSELINDSEFIGMCKSYGYKIIFMPHPQIQPYMHMFSPDKDIETYSYDKSWCDLFAESDIMITDYSSVAFDFAYLRKPVIYYQFDKDNFFTGHTYTEGYYNYETDGFGEILCDMESLKKTVERYLKNGCRLEKMYEDRISGFYEYNDFNSCERIYDMIIGQGD